ncbi:MAG TPA: type II CAAX endopeptidase family protein [Clostridia bacterium]|nr:type II CAAX endopeptidase family protein [Clostridia bacterium]
MKKARSLQILGGFTVLFICYQAPQGIYDYLLPNRLVWLAVSAVFFLVAYFVSCAMGTDGLRGYYFLLHRGWWFNLIVGLAIGIAFSAFAQLIGNRAGLYAVDAFVPLRALLLPMLGIAVGSFFASASEDVLTRSYVLRNGNWRTGAVFVVVSALIFVLNHIYVLDRGIALWTFLFVLGIAFAWPLYVTRSVWLTVGMHWGWNLVYHYTNIGMQTHELESGRTGTWISAVCAAGMFVAGALAARALPKAAANNQPADACARCVLPR